MRKLSTPLRLPVPSWTSTPPASRLHRDASMGRFEQPDLISLVFAVIENVLLIEQPDHQAAFLAHESADQTATQWCRRRLRSVPLPVPLELQAVGSDPATGAHVVSALAERGRAISGCARSAARAARCRPISRRPSSPPSAAARHRRPIDRRRPPSTINADHAGGVPRHPSRQGLNNSTDSSAPRTKSRDEVEDVAAGG